MTYSESVSVALVIQHAIRMRHNMSSVACRALQYFSILSHKQHDFRGKKLMEHKMCVDVCYKCCLKYFSFWEEMREML